MTSLPSDQLDHASIRFVEAFGQLVSEGGLAPSIGKVLGLLVITEAQKLSAKQIQAQLRLSSGSVSGAINLLLRFRYIKRVTVPGERRYYYEFEAESWQRAINARLIQMEQGIALANEGLKSRGNDPRMLGMLSMYMQLYAAIGKIKIKT